MPYRSQPSSNLPSERVSEDPPFTHVGVDFAGPLFIDDRNITEGANESSKVYVCLFTCALMRAVHLELTRGLSVQAFLMICESTRATSHAEIRQRQNLQIVMQGNSRDYKSKRSVAFSYRQTNRMELHHRTSSTVKLGGYWERLVQSVKRPLKKVLGRSTLNFDELNTLLVETESVINSRPIACVYDNKDCNSHPLTPSDLIYGRRISTNTNASHQEIMSTYQSLTQRLHHPRTSCNS